MDNDKQLSEDTATMAPSDPTQASGDAVAPPTPGKKTFQSLPEDVKCCIVEQISRPSDLKNICLVSKELHEIAVRFLYHRVSLDLGSFKDNLMPSFLSPRNIGLKHIRKIHLYLAHVTDRCNQEQQATFATRMLLEFLPENILEEFRCGFMETWCPWRPFSTDNLLLLFRRQKRMKWLEAMDMDRPMLQELKKCPHIEEGLFDNARTLALYPENRNSLNLGGYFVEKTREKLEELVVHTRFVAVDDESPARGDLTIRELIDTATGPGLLTSTLFSDFLPFETCTPFPHLTSLRLHEINLRYCADTWCKFIDFRNIRSLRVYYCPGADSLLGQLSRAKGLPKVLRVLEIQHRDNSDQEALVALDGFLCLTSGLEELLIDITNVKSMPAVAGIVRHGRTLESLNVHCTNKPPAAANPIMGDLISDPEELVFDTEDFEKLCSATSELEQLSCAWPERSLTKRLVHEDWCSFERSVSKLRKLVTLQITTWPINKSGSSILPRSIYEQLIQGAATHLFESVAKRTPPSGSATPSPPGSPVLAAQPDDDDAAPPAATTPPLLPRSRLRLIAFGISDKIYEREDSKNQLLYLRSSAFSAEGSKIIYAAPVGWCARQYLEPRSEILDFVLSKEARLPCRGERDMDGRFGFTVDEDD